MTKHEASEIIGGLSHTSKMPCPSWGISPKQCHTGRKLAKIPGSVCSHCYACKGMYSWPDVGKAHERRLAAFHADQNAWVNAMATLIKGRPYFRWFDSGDLQSINHLVAIIDVCHLTPTTKHWLPTREIGILRQCPWPWPSNLTIRLSGLYVDGKTQDDTARDLGINVSAVLPAAMNHTTQESKACRALLRGGACGLCRACWKRDVFKVTYSLH